MRANNAKGSIMLIFTAMLWGSSFIMQELADKAGVEAFTFNAARFLIGAVMLVPVIFIMDILRRRDGSFLRPQNKKEENRKLISASLICGSLLCVASNLQQIGFALGTTSDKAGFITALYILIVPVIGIFTGRTIRPIVWLCIGLAVAGLYLLCVKPAGVGIAVGDLVMLACAFAFALHIIAVDKFSGLVDGVRLSCLQFLVVGALSVIPMLIFETPSLGTIASAWFPITYVGVFSCSVAYTLQIFGQRTGINPTMASLIMSLESVFSLVGDCIVKGSLPTARVAIGAVLMFLAIVIAQLPPLSFRRKYKERRSY